MSATNAGPGRPPGISEATLERQRRVRAMHAKGISIATIAELEDRVPAYVRSLIGGAAKDSEPEPGEDTLPQPPRPLSRRTVVSRAWDFIEDQPTMTLGVAENDFWIRVLVAIHETGDGFRLQIGEEGCRFRTRADLALLVGAGHFCAGDKIDVEGWLTKLIARGRLIDIGGVDIGIPQGHPRLRLTPTNSKPRKPTPKPQASDDDRRQGAMLHSFPGGRLSASDDGELNLRFADKNPSGGELNMRRTADLIPSGADKIADSIPGVACVGTAAAAANAKEDQSISISSSTVSRAGDGELNMRFGELNMRSENPSGADEIKPKRPDDDLVNLVAELVELARLGRHPNPKDLRAVQGWLEKGEPAATMRAVIETVVSRPNGTRPTSLAYFDRAMGEAMRAAVRPSGAAPPAGSPARPTMSDADQAIQAMLKPSCERWRKDMHKYPFPGNLAAFKAAISSGVQPLADRWIEYDDAWNKAGCPAPLKPPDFTLLASNPSAFEARLFECEEGITDPGA